MQHICSTRSLTVGQCGRELLSRYSSAGIHPNTQVIQIKTRGRRTHTHNILLLPATDPRLCFRSEEDGRITAEMKVLIRALNHQPPWSHPSHTSCTLLRPLTSSITSTPPAAPPQPQILHLQLGCTCSCRISDITSCSEVNKEALHAIKTNRLEAVRKTFRLSRHRKMQN